jgi:hypothetical protein
MTKSTTSAALVALAGSVALATALGGSMVLAAPAKKGIDPAADGMLRQMTTFLAGLNSFRVDSFSVDENALTSGEKIQHTADSVVSVQRPNRLRNTPLGEGQGLGLWYDGNNMTVACKASNTYTTIAAPPTLDTAIDNMRKQFKIDAPGADLLYSRPYDILMEQVTSGRVVGHETVGGIKATHLAFEGDEVDWQIWIQEGPQPVPLRFVITTKTIRGGPQFSVQLSNWQLQPTLVETMFQFQPPAGATSVKTVDLACGVAH